MGIEITIRIDDVKPENQNGVDPKDDKTNVSQYARFFNESCAAWTKDSECNLMFLRLQQEYANRLLKERGYIFLNEIYDLLGIPRTKAGQVVGWVYNKENPVGDNCVDFDVFSQRNEDFVNGLERSALLDFNVDGMILDKVL